MSFMQEFLSAEIDVGIMLEPDRGTIALFSLELESVMYLRIRLGSGTFQVGTFFDFGRDHSKIYKKQKRKCKPITIEEIRKMIR